MDVLHTAVWIDDVDATLAFYGDGLGLALEREFERDGVRNYFLGGESDAQIQLRYDGTDREVDPSGIDHLAVAAADVGATVDRLVAEFDSELVAGPTTIEELGIRIAFVTDPEGYVVELIERLE